MKKYVITLSKYFPANHPKKGDTTNFEKSISEGTKIHTIRQNYSFWKKLFKEIQKGKAILSVREWTGKPYNSKQKELFKFDKSDGIGLEKLILSEDRISLSELATNDGLSEIDFCEWFKKVDKNSPMAIIHFTNFRYGKI